MKVSKINLETLFVGDEPVFGDPKTELPITRALSWYSNQKDWKDSKKYTIDYAKKHLSKDIQENLSQAHEDLYKNLGFVCRMIMRGAPLDKQEWIINRINEIINYDKSTEIVSEVIPQQKETRSIQDRVFDQATQYINEIEGHVDIYIKTKTTNFKCYDYLTSNSIKPIYMKQIIDHYLPLQEEIKLTLSKSDDQLNESYSHWSKKELTNYLNFITGIIDDCNKFSSNTKTVRKTKKKKVITADKKVSKLQYKKEDTETKTVSINPADIISAKQLWVYNTKYKKLGVYYSKDDAGFGVKGTTLENFDENSSITKTLRKPLEVLPIVVKGKKLDLKKIMNEIKTKEDVLTGRINSDTILLKVIK